MSPTEPSVIAGQNTGILFFFNDKTQKRKQRKIITSNSGRTTLWHQYQMELTSSTSLPSRSISKDGDQITPCTRPWVGKCQENSIQSETDLFFLFFEHIVENWIHKVFKITVVFVGNNQVPQTVLSLQSHLFAWQRDRRIQGLGGVERENRPNYYHLNEKSQHNEDFLFSWCLPRWHLLKCRCSAP